MSQGQGQGAGGSLGGLYQSQGQGQGLGMSIGASQGQGQEHGLGMSMGVSQGHGHGLGMSMGTSQEQGQGLTERLVNPSHGLGPSWLQGLGKDNMLTGSWGSPDLLARPMSDIQVSEQYPFFQVKGIAHATSLEWCSC